MTILTSTEIWEKLDNEEKYTPILYLNGNVGLLENSTYESEVEETEYIWKAMSKDTILITKK